MRFLRALLFVFITVSSFSCAANKDYLITIETSHGDIVAVLFDDTPAHKSNFIELAEAGRFDSTEFQRIMKNFMIQGGDVFTKENLPPQDWPTLPAEIRASYFHKKGMIAAARQPDGVNPDRRSNGSQFYITIGKVYNELELTTNMAELQKSLMKYMELGSQEDLKIEYIRLYNEQKYDSLTSLILSKRDELEKSLNVNLTKDFTSEQIEAYTTIGGVPHLDKEYTVFGEVIQGLEVAEEISNVPTGYRDVPNEPVYMKVTVEKMSRNKIEKEYGYSYPNDK
ncbi:peptidyl-prolyl cis-trans isomerase B (cyclophilin B) [Algoriphagus ratkowskyi]|uniref:peptidylprolyl isomerase n=1 Tax=Algoriphagus ratkowskyi TaxID=57028 RepID=A0A2W7SMB1_9BACT|nr:peptidylprolyl isomerase [Algoriphagus ratkowskyi]PZX51852.1 peptidyl-prolyl cis-trans isomerase B (cyclophilin B) [Algoriphagus ratkowskyi]TXD76014.1 peptidylprolyl isomerase [Algoriphagus ratkowskyi]